MVPSRPSARSRRRGLPALLAAGVLSVLSLLAGAFAQEAAWEFRVCADPTNLPYSSRDGSGFENRIAELLAEEMGAELTYDWSAFTADMVNLRLRGGECDAIIGVPDGYGGVTTTLAYYRSPYVFVTRADRDLEIESLDDPVLEELTIGVQNRAIPPHAALLNRGIAENVEGPSGREANPFDRVAREVAAGEVDVGIMWGPNAGWAAERIDAELRLQPVTPQFDPPFLNMSTPMTIGVRQGDTALRDRLDLAIAERWEDIQAVLRDHDVPLTPTPAPVASLQGQADGEAEEGPVEVGVLLPFATGLRSNLTSLYEVVGDAALHGVELATSDLNAEAGRDRYVLRISPTPNAASARRAADRMTTLGDVDALVGGLGVDQAETLAATAAEQDVLFLNVGFASPALRERCEATTLHVEASAADYLAALVGRHAEEGARDWFVVREASPWGEGVAEVARAVLEGAGAVAGSAAVAPGQPVYYDAIDAIAEAAPDGVLVLLDPPDQIAFVGQALDAGVEAPLALLPSPVTQTRDFLGALRDRAGVAAEGLEHVVAWEPTRPGGEELAERFASRFGEPMEASAFAGYQAVAALDAAATATESRDAEDLTAYLTASDTTVPGPKGELAFEGRRLVQPLDVIEIDPEAPWSNTVVGKVAIASFLESIGSRGDGNDGNGCRTS